MNDTVLSTEERIKEAAKAVFLEKGFDGTTTRDIAQAAGINSALMNYYFRSKEKLFQFIFDDLCHLMFAGMIDTFNQPISLKEKISALIDHQFQMMMCNPNLTIFIMNELHKNPERMAATIGMAKKIPESIFRQQVDQAISEGKIAPVSAHHIMTMIIANIQFLFVSKPMTMLTQGLDEAGFDKFAKEHMGYVKEMICEYLFAPQGKT
ncbi:TetR/AcrR family transcriptional regulator [Spirosoma radiotolerans]|uniref:TetR family transcriptional regulator n=1 Tax=Spirosoma radiotolerans TaxID=1379870 RepID=A0A0E3V8K9_9BACT|nr:TetR/AcrR family transcriptional regulator [Spirosoma radiotolerans]AKD56842.1 TetR family transcriptional regulator [Spirosoma radiotolerans]